MKTKVFILLLLVLSMTAVAQQKKVAVYVTGQQSGITKVLGDQLVSAFANNGKYIAIERTASFLSELNKEQGYQRTGAVDDNELSRLGKQFGVQLVCVAEITEVFGENYVSARLIDVETAEILNTSNTNSALSNMDEMRSVCSKLAEDLTSETVQEKAAKEAERQKKQAEAAEKERLEREKMQALVDKAIEVGYIKIGDLLVTTSHPHCTKKEAKSNAETTVLGGITGWRIPTKVELISIKHTLEDYSEKCNNTPTTWSFYHYYDSFWYCVGDKLDSRDWGDLILVHDLH